MADSPTLKNGRLHIEMRDVVQVGVFLLALGGAYKGITTKLDDLSERVKVMDARLWELQGRANGQQAVAAACPQDVTRVALRNFTIGAMP